MKHLNLLKSTLLLFALVVGSTSLWAKQQTSVTQAAKVTSTSFSWTGSIGEKWTGTVTEGAVDQSVTNGYAQVGSKKSPSKKIVVSTSGITETIKSIVVDCASYSGLGTLSVTVGGEAFGKQNQSTPSWSGDTGGNVTFIGEATGAIEITMNNGSGGRAMYIKSITVTYGPDIPSDPELTEEEITWDFSDAGIGSITAPSSEPYTPIANTLTATDGATTMTYMAGKSCTIENGYLKAGGKSTMTGSSATRYFILHITKSGILTITSNSSKPGEYLIYQGSTNNITDATQKASITTSAGSLTEVGEYDIADGSYLFVGFKATMYTEKLNWNEATGIILETSSNMDGWRSFYDATQDYEVDENTKIYVAAVSAKAGTVELTQKNATKIPHGEAVILKTTAGDHKMVLTKTTGAATLDPNVLAYATSGTIDGYRLGYKDDPGVAFYKYNAAAPASGVVYIDKSNVNIGAGAHEFLAMSFGDVTGIESLTIMPSRKGEGMVYDLQGRRVAQPAKGLYIVNGRKVIVP